MKPYKATAHINSLNGEKAEITVLEQVGGNDYIVEYKGVKCHAIADYNAEHILIRACNVGKPKVTKSFIEIRGKSYQPQLRN